MGELDGIWLEDTCDDFDSIEYEWEVMTLLGMA